MQTMPSSYSEAFDLEDTVQTVVVCYQLYTYVVDTDFQYVDMYSVNLSLKNDSCFDATYSVVAPAAGSANITARGFHAAVVVKINQKPTLLIWGGMHNNVPIGELQLFDIESRVWRAGSVIGSEPSPRFGHSCSVLEDEFGNTHLVMVGGSDGSDMIRDGRDYRQIHVLSVIRNPQTPEADTLVWSSPPINASGQVPGRCHT
jgi:hypothetical protein